MADIADSVENLKKLFTKGNKPKQELRSAVVKLLRYRLKPLMSSFISTDVPYEGITIEGYDLKEQFDDVVRSAINAGATKVQSGKAASKKYRTIKMCKDGINFYIQEKFNANGCKVFIDFSELLKEFQVQ